LRERGAQDLRPARRFGVRVRAGLPDLRRVAVQAFQIPRHTRVPDANVQSIEPTVVDRVDLDLATCVAQCSGTRMSRFELPFRLPGINARRGLRQRISQRHAAAFAACRM
jgi:hypothetical protein